jgi:hypothetical protein
MQPTTQIHTPEAGDLDICRHEKGKAAPVTGRKGTQGL